MNYKDERLAGTVEYIRDKCEDSKDFEPIIENETGVYDLFLSKLEKLDPKAYAHAYAYSDDDPDSYSYVYAYAYANDRAKIKQLFIESIKEVNSVDITEKKHKNTAKILTGCGLLKSPGATYLVVEALTQSDKLNGIVQNLCALIGHQDFETLRQCDVKQQWEVVNEFLECIRAELMEYSDDNGDLLPLAAVKLQEYE